MLNLKCKVLNINVLHFVFSQYYSNFVLEFQVAAECREAFMFPGKFRNNKVVSVYHLRPLFF